ncbi:MAG: 16S rRNA (uracil(1498)-N(3))-methyltransferase [Corynebacterium camporealensis]|uniref:16S rRNA (uracil(1498)-N(3))-methyltransferase n=1 Tax=Corynebacterium camporealensis TaxID=161896 RepID=UPI002A90FF56|nr:16S rRNA (uracil(1498)-N(3))-methyltransferase [Corynebacterium camporealensis]MDY5840947.1 16S rRNA (uracil(1498)-N(3))-methyltransferase [Corynebacterium camporealensis]
MSLPVFVHDDLSSAAAGEIVELSGPEGRHAVTVKRMTAGEELMLIDGSGTHLRATITQTSDKDTLQATVDAVDVAPEPTPRVTIVQAIPKSERAELAVDLATQAGADEIIAWQADRCVAKWDAKKAPKALRRWQDAATAAAKQSRRVRIPNVAGPLTTGELVAKLKKEPDAQVLVLHEEASLSLKNIDLGTQIYVLVGPEGGIGKQELEKLQEVGAEALKLGPEVLRTASAAMVALAGIGMRTARW